MGVARGDKQKREVIRIESLTRPAGMAGHI